MADNVGAIAPSVKVSGRDLADSWVRGLVSLRVHRAANLVGRAVLTFTDNGFGLATSDLFALGTSVSIREPQADTLFEGTVTGVTLEQRQNTLPQLVVTADDAAYKLSRGTPVATFLNSTFAQVITAMARKHGMQATVSGANQKSEYLLQTGSDLDLLNGIVERLGLVWWVDGTNTLMVESISLKAASSTLTLGESLADFSVRASGLRPTELTVNGWDPATQQNVTGQSTDPPAEVSTSMLSKYVGTAPGRALATAKNSLSTMVPLTSSEATTIAKALHDDWTSAAVTATGTTGIDSSLKPGVTIQVTGAGPASGKYLLTGVEHIYDHRGFVTQFTAGSRRPASLVDTLGPGGADPGFLSGSLVIAVVTDNADPDDAGRVKVKYAGVDGSIESPWARVVSMGAGSARGVVFQPEVNDEVLVGFERGDTRRPVVLGGLFSKRNTLPKAKGEFVGEGKVNYRRITTRKNHLIELADGEEPTDQHVLIKLGTVEHSLRLGADAFALELTAGKPLTIKAGSSSFQISDTGDITIEGNNITIKAKAALNIEGTGQVSVKSDGQVGVQGAMVDVKANGLANVQANGPLALKGAVVQVN